MPFIADVPPEAADGLLKREYEAAVRRAGRIWNIVSVQSQSPESLRAGMRLYQQVMYGDSPLSRAQREMIAVVTSMANECVY